MGKNEGGRKRNCVVAHSTLEFMGKKCGMHHVSWLLPDDFMYYCSRVEKSFMFGLVGLSHWKGLQMEKIKPERERERNTSPEIYFNR